MQAMNVSGRCTSVHKKEERGSSTPPFPGTYRTEAENVLLDTVLGQKNKEKRVDIYLDSRTHSCKVCAEEDKRIILVTLWSRTSQFKRENNIVKANTTEGRDAIQMDLEELEICVHKNFMKLSKSSQGAATGLRQSQISRLELMESNPAKEELGHVVKERWMCPGSVCWADAPA
ncbi:hypothetical protein DUI87_29817 [Hirundo rustica rustica]|uniref:Uncharacterized protein n=1 Tax=Hirundo rustica rustica TaxID=333673 RepID=A0A3M0IYQ5_HIRRU|nr:hypothetical protein DUI87_29817 [Hirundo rustica rustica]